LSVVAELKKRKLVKVQKIISYNITKGPEYATEIVELTVDLTEEMIAS
jgi:phenylalanyl-tRNA synthetase alpha chain